MTERVCLAVLGDSFVAGIGDREHRGWVGRLAATVNDGLHPVVCYELGVGGETTADVLVRADRELAPRLQAETRNGVIISTGVNDTDWEDRSPRLRPAASGDALQGLLSTAERYGPALVVGPPPVADEDHNARIAALADAFRTACTARHVGFVDTYRPLRGDGTWMTQVAATDGAHPDSAGYSVMTHVIQASHAWRRFCTGLGLQLPVQ